MRFMSLLEQPIYMIESKDFPMATIPKWAREDCG